MTTIVYHDNVLAVDSLSTMDGLIVDDDTNKIKEVDGVVFAICGSTNEHQEIINANFGKECSEKTDVAAIIVEKGEVYYAGINREDGFFKHKTTGRSFCIGSGSDFAWTAIDMGCNAVGAVKMAMKRDAYTGGRIRTKKIKSNGPRK